MRAMLFGGSGFVGTHLAAALVRDGFDVTIADLAQSPHSPEEAKFEVCDVREPIEIARSEPFDLVYNLAAVHRTPGHSPHEYYETNINGALNITDWCEGGGERSLFFTSSISVYGTTEQVKTERSALTPNSDYGRSKLIAEKIHLRWQRAAAGRKLSIARPAVVFGPGEHGNFTRLAAALARRRFMYAGRRDVIKACGYVGDLVRALRFAEKRPEDVYTFNFCYPRQYTIEDICRAFQDVVGYALPRQAPKTALNLVMGLLSVANPQDRGTLSAARLAKLTASTNIFPAQLADSGFEWDTDLESGLRAWCEASGGRFV